MSKLLWNDVKDLFDPDLMGALPDVVVPGASIADWQAVLDLVTARGWKHQYREGGSVLPVPSAATVLSRPAQAEYPQLQVWLTDDISAIFRFYSAEEIDFDIDLRKLQGQRRLDVFCEFLTAIGRRLDKPVLMYAEGGGSSSILGFEVDSDGVVLNAQRAQWSSRPRT